MLPKKQLRILSKVTKMRDIKIAHIYFKEGQLDTAPMDIIDVNMQSASITNQSIFLVNTFMVAGKSLQAMETKIDRLNKKIDRYTKDYSLKDKMIAQLQNQKKELLRKSDKKKQFEKILGERKFKLDGVNKLIKDLKSQATIIYGQKAKQVEAKLQKIIVANKVLIDDNTKLLLIIKSFKKSLV